MNRVRIVWPCVVAAVAMSTIAVASASAERPEFGRCLKQVGGKFEDGGCKKPSTPGKEKFEWTPVIEKNQIQSNEHIDRYARNGGGHQNHMHENVD